MDALGALRLIHQQMGKGQRTIETGQGFCWEYGMSLNHLVSEKGEDEANSTKYQVILSIQYHLEQERAERFM